MELSEIEGFDFLEEEEINESGDEETEDSEEEGFEIVYEQEEIENLYNDYREIAGEPEKTENQYILAMKNERKSEMLELNTDLEMENEIGSLILTESGKGHETKLDLLKVEYSHPVFFNDQLTYQSVFIENNENGKTVYELTLEACSNSGMDVKISYDEDHRTFYLSSMDGKEDGMEIDGNKTYLEFWTKGEKTNTYRIGDKSIDQQRLDKGDKLEWRLSTERESGCGGGGYEQSNGRNEIDEILMYPNNGNPVKGYFPNLGYSLETNPFLYMDFGVALI